MVVVSTAPQLAMSSIIPLPSIQISLPALSLFVSLLHFHLSWLIPSFNYPVLQNVMWAYQWTQGGFPGGAVVENLPANAGDTGSSPGLGGSHMPRSN